MNNAATSQWLKEHGIALDESFTDALRSLALTYKKTIKSIC